MCVGYCDYCIRWAGVQSKFDVFVRCVADDLRRGVAFICALAYVRPVVSDCAKEGVLCAVVVAADKWLEMIPFRRRDDEETMPPIGFVDEDGTGCGTGGGLVARYVCRVGGVDS